MIAITSPLVFTKGPPELPGLIAASVWTNSSIPSSNSIFLFSELIIPVVTVGPPVKPKGLPIAMTIWPTLRPSESPNSIEEIKSIALLLSWFSIFKTARSVI